MNLGDLKRAIADCGLPNNTEVYINNDLDDIGGIITRFYVRGGGIVFACKNEKNQKVTLAREQERRPHSGVNLKATIGLLICSEEVWEEETEDDESLMPPNGRRE